jgi:uncharacterized membrane protein
MQTLILGLVLFLGIHSISIVAPAWRDRMAARLGEWPWKGLYSVASIVGFVLMLRGYASLVQTSDILYTPAPWMRVSAYVLMLPVFPLLFAAYLPGRIRTATKHPMLTAVKLWALAHLLANGALADVVLFGSLLIWAGLDRMSFKRRPQRPVPSAPPGPANDVIAVVGGLGVYVLFVYGLHARLVGIAI